MHAATKETTVAWTWRRERLPTIMDRRTAGSSRSPTLAAVLRRAERFISRLPFRFMTTGMMMMSWWTSCIAVQRCSCTFSNPLLLINIITYGNLVQQLSREQQTDGDEEQGRGGLGRDE